MTRILIAWFLLLATAGAAVPAARASEAARLAILGVSPDGRYLAFEQHGHMAGSGTPFSRIAVLDTRSGAPAAVPVLAGFFAGETRPLAAVRRAARDEAEPAFARLGIDPDVLTDPLVRRLPTDLGGDPREVLFSRTPRLRGFLLRRLLLKLETRPVAATCGPAEGFYAPTAWTARLLLVDVENGAVAGVVEDIVPSPWLDACAHDWRLGEIHALPGAAGRLVVFLGVDVPGFEGHSLRWVPVLLDADGPSAPAPSD